MALAGLLGGPAAALPQDLGGTTVVSVDANGVVGNNRSGPEVGGLAVSEDGRFVVFSSSASNLVAGDVNGREDVFVRDRVSGTTVLASLGDGGQQGDGDATHCDISDDGRYVAFRSTATNLVPGDTNGFADVFLRDLVLGTTVLVSRTAQGGVAAGGSAAYPTISADGARVAFESSAAGLVAADTNLNVDVFVFERATGSVELVSQGPGGSRGTVRADAPTSRPTAGGSRSRAPRGTWARRIRTSSATSTCVTSSREPTCA